MVTELIAEPYLEDSSMVQLQVLKAREWVESSNEIVLYYSETVLKGNSVL